MSLNKIIKQQKGSTSIRFCQISRMEILILFSIIKKDLALHEFKAKQTQHNRLSHDTGEINTFDSLLKECLLDPHKP